MELKTKYPTLTNKFNTSIINVKNWADNSNYMKRFSSIIGATHKKVTRSFLEMIIIGKFSSPVIIPFQFGVSLWGARNFTSYIPWFKEEDKIQIQNKKSYSDEEIDDSIVSSTIRVVGGTVDIIDEHLNDEIDKELEFMKYIYNN
jgi:hypothetical protein